MDRLGAATLAGLARAVRRPAYDRTKLTVGMAHLGVGAFHRCHQAEFTDDALGAEFGPWGEIGISIRPPLLSPMLVAQDGLYTRTLRDEGTTVLRAIGCLRETVDAQNDGEIAVAALAAPRISIVSMTVTEKGYCHKPATGLLDFDHPDIAHDLAGAGSPRSAPGVLVAALARRRESGAGGLTLMSCDNIPGNGKILRVWFRRWLNGVHPRWPTGSPRRSASPPRWSTASCRPPPRPISPSSPTPPASRIAPPWSANSSANG